MTPQLYNAVKTAKSDLGISSGRVLEVGSLNFNGTIRPVFPDATSYVGVDMQDGRDVDVVLNSHKLDTRFQAASIDTLVCLETLEHDDRFWLSLAQFWKVLSPGGHFFLSTPTYGFPYHPYPHDYYRFSEDAYRNVLMAGYDLLSLEYLRDDAGFPGILAVGRKPTMQTTDGEEVSGNGQPTTETT